MRTKDDHSDRVNRVLDYIGGHLDGDLSLDTLSAVGCFSSFHFHRIFQTVTGETLNAHVRRVRLERAATLMKASPGKRITDIALETGFAGSAEFSRAFKNHFNRAPSSWDRRSPLQKSKICQAPETHPFYSVEELEGWKAAANVRVEVNRLGACRFVYNRIFAPYANNRLVDGYHALIAWLAERQIDVRDVVIIGMSLDDPSLTPAENCRYDLGAAFPKEAGGMLWEIIRARGRSRIATPPTDLPGGFSIRDFEPQEVGAIHCIGDLGNVDRAWHYLYRIWLPAVSYEPADLPAMQLFVRIPEEIGWTTFDLHACLPVTRL